MTLEKTLLILEVSKKQDYIFSSQKLQENVMRSNIIRYVTSDDFFKRCAPNLYRTEHHMVYSGGGHTILQFDSPEQARSFAALVTETAMREFFGLEMFVKQMPYDPSRTPGENLKELSAALERKKALRRSGFQRLTFGVDLPPALPPQKIDNDLTQPPQGWEYVTDFSMLADPQRFLAVVHIDGNAMGQRVQDIYDANTTDWDSCCQALRQFSIGIQSNFETAFQAVAETLAANADHLQLERPFLPLRPVILAGDDVCFVCRGDLGLECARVFTEQLTATVNDQDQKPYACCAGVAIVHQKYPFHRAYALSEELCSNAKRFGAETSRQVSALDFHIEFGQLKNSLAELRQDYETDDHNRMELRPLAVVVPSSISMTEELEVRSYGFYRQMWLALRGESGKIARSKLKELRSAVKHGMVETEHFMQDKEISDLVEHCFQAQFRTSQRRMEQLGKILSGDANGFHKPFMRLGSRYRCVLYDAIEMLDHDQTFEEVSL